MTARPTKRQRTEGGAYHDSVTLFPPIVQSREGGLCRVGGFTRNIPTEREPQHDPTWSTTQSWAPVDDTEFCLDPDSNQYDALVNADIMDTEVLAEPLPVKKKQSRVSKRPHVIWKELHRQAYLDEVTRWAGRGDFHTAKECPDCLARKVDTPGVPEYRCQECFLPDLVCSTCCIKRHRTHPLHRISKWSRNRFIDISLQAMGLKVQLNHASMFCSNPVACHASFLVIHSNGIHAISIHYCGCTRAIPQHLQLLRRGFYPASQLAVKTCATFELLELLHKLALTTKASTYDFYRALETTTNNTGISVPPNRYRALFRMVLQWRHLKLLKWGGRAHEPSGVAGTEVGELALLCPSCPRPGINLPLGWENEPLATKFLYMLFICMDANFRLKNQLVSNYSQDPGLGIGWAYMVPREPYESYVLSRANDADISTCVGLQALAKASTKFSKGLRHTGVGGVFCGRSEMIMPVGIGNLQKGERYANMDFIFASVIRCMFIRFLILLPLVLVSYDIACQWFINLFKRMETHWPEEIRISSTTKFVPAIPKLHEPMHGKLNHEVYSLNFIPGVGASDLETPERVWAGHNALGNSTKTQGPGSRSDVLDDHFSFWNWRKYVGLGNTLMRKYKASLAERNIQREGHRGLTESLEDKLVSSWEAMCVEWELDEFPKTKSNPYHTAGICLTEAQIRKELAEDEERRLANGGLSLHATSASAFLTIGLDLEHIQRRVRRLAKTTTANSTTRQEGGLTEQRNMLRTRLRGWEVLLSIYLPGLLQYRADIAATSPDTSTAPDHPENAELWLPSCIPTLHRRRICIQGLPEMEEKLRTAQAHDALENVRHILKIKSRMVLFKNKNIRGQREGTKSRSVIDRVHERARVAAEKYRAARAAKMALIGAGSWEDILRILDDKDIRAYQDPNQLRVRTGRRGTLEDDQLTEAANTSTPPDQGINLLHKARTKRDGTGETHRTLSWIWTTQSTVPTPDDESDDILRAEWAKSRARATRAKEEVMLLREEMRRVIAFLEWKAEWWDRKMATRILEGKDLNEGLRAYAQTQVDLQRSLAAHFATIWKTPLEDIPEGRDDNEANAAAPDDDEDDEEDDGDALDENPEDEED